MSTNKKKIEYLELVLVLLKLPAQNERALTAVYQGWYESDTHSKNPKSFNGTV